jgi:hypothetical protein
MRLRLSPGILIASLCLCLCACSGTTKDIDTDPPEVLETADTAVEDSDPPIIDTDPPTPIADCDTTGTTGLASVCDFSVNQASVEIDGSVTGQPLSLVINQSAATPSGAYNGAGTGNRSIAGFHDHDRLALSDLTLLSMDLEYVSGSQLFGPELGLILDLDCDGATLHYGIMSWGVLTDTVNQGDGIERYEVAADDRVWAVNGELPDPADSSLIIAPDPQLNPLSRPLATLAEIAEAYPDACVRNIDSLDAAMPVNTETSGILLTLGNSTTILRIIWQVHRFVINDVVYDKP